MNVPSLLTVENTVLVLVDVQVKLARVMFDKENLIANLQKLIKGAQALGVPIVMTEQYPQGLGPTHADVRAEFDALTVPKRWLAKTSFGCCGEPAFDAALVELRPGVPAAERQIVVAGIEAHVCVMATVLELLRRGEQVYPCWECVSGRGAEYRANALERMARAGARITNHESVAFEWARGKEHPAFKALSRLLREGQVEP